MRAKAHILALAALVCVLLAGTPDASARDARKAKPTRTMPRESARRLTAPTARAGFYSSKAGTGSKSAAKAGAKGHSPAVRRHEPSASHKAGRRGHAKNISLVMRRNIDAPANASTVNRVHAWEMAHGRISAGDAAELAPELRHLPSAAEVASTPLMLPSLYDRRGRLVMPAPLYGSREVLQHQNEMADREGLTRVADDDDLLDLRRERKLVALPEGETLHIDERLPADRRYSRPWTASFLAAFAHDFYTVFHEPLQVNSAVRTVEVQQRLLHTNGNAAAIEGDTASPHLTGQAVDIAKRGFSMKEIAWVRAYLQPLILSGSIDVEEEFRQSCFHISVYRSYLPAPSRAVTVRAAASGSEPIADASAE